MHFLKIGDRLQTLKTGVNHQGGIPSDTSKILWCDRVPGQPLLDDPGSKVWLNELQNPIWTVKQIKIWTVSTSAILWLNPHKIFFSIKQNAWTLSLLHCKLPHLSSINSEVVSKGQFKATPENASCAKKQLSEQDTRAFPFHCCWCCAHFCNK